MAAMQRGNTTADTTYTKIFVGGLAWETQRDTMRRYFEQFGEIVEAVVITDKNTGRSKGYGFVTFKDPESAMQACENPTPVIDGRRANCNLAFLGANNNNNNNRLRPPIAQIEMGRIRPMISSAYHGPTASTMATAYYHQHANYALPYSYYGYSSSYSQENMYPMNYYGVGGQQQQQQQQQQQFTPYYPVTAPTGVYANYQPYYSSYAQSTHNLQYYPQMLQYSHYLPQQFGSSSTPVLPLPTSIPGPTTGVNAGSSIASSSTRTPVMITSNQNKTY